MGWKNWEVELTLLQYRGEWYQTTDDMHQGRSLMQYFDTIVEVNGNKFNLIKDRRLGVTGHGVFDDVMRMKLFALGKTFHDLPEFTKSNHSGNCVIGYKDNGDLFEYPELTQTL